MKIKIAYSPVWCGLIGILFAFVMGLSMDATRSFWWWFSQGALALICVVIALVHGHFVWRRKDRQQQMARWLGVPVERTVMLGKNAIGYVPEEQGRCDEKR